MSKTKISEYSATANSNTDIGGINIDEGCAPSGINDAIRTLMAQLKNFQTGASSDPVTIGGVLTVTGGSAAAPAITTSGDTNTGIEFPAADTVGIATGGTERVRVDSSGNVGVGVTPSAWSSAWKTIENLGGSISSSAATNLIFLQNAYYDGAAYRYRNDGLATQYRLTAGNHNWYTATSGTAGNTFTFTQAMTLDASGKLGVGTTSPTYKLDVADTNSIIASFYRTSASAGLLLGANTSGAIVAPSGVDAIQFYNAATTVINAKIDSSGNLLVGCTNGDPYRFRASTNSGTTTWQFGPYSTVPGNYYIVNGAGTGVYITSGNTSWSTVSDERFKDIIEPISNATEKVSQLRAVIGKYKADEQGTRRSFLIAQDVQAVFPEAVNASNPDELALQYTEVIPLLTAAIQEQQAIITQLQADVAALKA